jgi:hypothetical protein
MAYGRSRESSPDCMGLLRVRGGAARETGWADYLGAAHYADDVLAALVSSQEYFQLAQAQPRCAPGTEESPLPSTSGGTDRGNATTRNGTVRDKWGAQKGRPHPIMVGRGQPSSRSGHLAG